MQQKLGEEGVKLLTIFYLLSLPKINFNQEGEQRKLTKADKSGRDKSSPKLVDVNCEQSLIQKLRIKIVKIMSWWKNIFLPRYI